MNKILKTARMVKGIAPEELASQLGLTITEYLELETEVTKMTPRLCKLFARYFDLPVYYFKSAPLPYRKRADLLRQQLLHINNKETDATGAAIPGQISAFADPRLQILDLKYQLAHSMAHQLELTECLIDFIDLYLNAGKPVPPSLFSVRL